MWEDEGELLGSAVVRLKKKKTTVFVIFLFTFFLGGRRDTNLEVVQNVF